MERGHRKVHSCLGLGHCTTGIWEGVRDPFGKDSKPALESRAPAREHLPLPSLKRGSRPAKAGLESYQHQVEGGSDFFFFFNQESVGKEEEMIFSFLTSENVPEGRLLRAQTALHSFRSFPVLL